MAKKPQAGLTELPHDEDFLDRAGDEAAPEDGEKAALEAKVRELEHQLARERASRVVDAEPAARGEYWKVELEGAKTHVVRAPDAANAWGAYCREMGVIASEHRPSASPASREEYLAAQARRRGLRPEEYTED